MKINRRDLVIGSLASGISFAARAQTPAPALEEAPPAGLPQPKETIDLWPDGAPGMPTTPPVETVVSRSSDAQLADRAVHGISVPRMAVFRPAIANGAAVVVTPGGAYRRIVIDREGYEVARWLAARGFTVFVLFYRLPGEGWANGPDVSLADAQRAVRLVRARAANFGIDPERVAALGFSAGGHLCADLATRFAQRVYERVDAADDLAARPYAAAPIYPVISMSMPVTHEVSRAKLIGAEASPAHERAHSPHYNVPADAPPCFLVHAEDDASVVVENSLLFRDALSKKGIAVETHLFAHGGHGFGLSKAIGKPAGIWPQLFLNWANSTGLV